MQRRLQHRHSQPSFISFVLAHKLQWESLSIKAIILESLQRRTVMTQKNTRERVYQLRKSFHKAFILHLKREKISNEQMRLLSGISFGWLCFSCHTMIKEWEIKFEEFFAYKQSSGALKAPTTHIYKYCWWCAFVYSLFSWFAQLLVCKRFLCFSTRKINRKTKKCKEHIFMRHDGCWCEI